MKKKITGASHLNIDVTSFKGARNLQRSQRGELSELAFKLPRYAEGTRAFKECPLLAHETWILKDLVPLAKPRENLQDDTDQFITTYARSAVSHEPWSSTSREFLDAVSQFLPNRPEGEAPFTSLADAIKEIEKPPSDLFVSRPSYTLKNVSLAESERISLEFGKGSYFDYINCGEMLALELSYHCGNHPLEKIHATDLEKRLSLRHLAGEWHSIERRPSIAGVNCLTVFKDAETKKAYFPLLRRSPRVASAVNTHHVVPAGEFQPMSPSLPDFVGNCTLWQTLLREFAEEILRQPEAKHDEISMMQLAGLGAIRCCLDLIESGCWKTYFLGIGLDPLTLKPELLLVSIVDRGMFIDYLKQHLRNEMGTSCLHQANHEGTLELGNHPFMGHQVTASTIELYMRSSGTLPAGRGCLELFERKLDFFLSLDLCDRIQS